MKLSRIIFKSSKCGQAVFFSLSFGMLSIAAGSAFAQHHRPVVTSHPDAAAPALQFKEVANQALSDPELKQYSMQSSVMTVPPGFVDSIAHRHDAELFGYVLEGSVDVGLERAAPVTYPQGKMFYEQRNVLHTLLRNTSTTQPAKVLLVYIIKQGRQTYTREPGN